MSRVGQTVIWSLVVRERGGSGLRLSQQRLCCPGVHGLSVPAALSCDHGVHESELQELRGMALPGTEHGMRALPDVLSGEDDERTWGRREKAKRSGVSWEALASGGLDMCFAFRACQT
jgi:hypothetical protein